MIKQIIKINKEGSACAFCKKHKGNEPIYHEEKRVIAELWICDKCERGVEWA
jgi:hypothetical protein